MVEASKIISKKPGNYLPHWVLGERFDGQACREEESPADTRLQGQGRGVSGWEQKDSLPGALARTKEPRRS